MPVVIDKTLRPVHIKVYAALREALIEHGICPSKVELRDATLLSITTVIKVINDLRRKGYIQAPKHGVRALRLTDMDRILALEEPDPWAELKPKKYWRSGP